MKPSKKACPQQNPETIKKWWEIISLDDYYEVASYISIDEWTKINNEIIKVIIKSS